MFAGFKKSKNPTMYFEVRNCILHRKTTNRLLKLRHTFFPHFDLLYLEHTVLPAVWKLARGKRKCVNENRLLQVLKYPLCFSKYTLNGGSCGLDGELSACAPALASASEMRRPPLVRAWAVAVTAGTPGCDCYTKQHARVGGTPCVRHRGRSREGWDAGCGDDCRS